MMTDYLYQFVIQKREQAIQIKKKYGDESITFADIDLSEIEFELIEWLSKILCSDIYQRNKDEKVYTLFLASLCHISRNGFTQGGILKTIDSYLDYEFDRNKYYYLLKKTLTFFNITVVFEGKDYYQNAIAAQAGIPYNFHKLVFNFSKIFWVWFKNYSQEKKDKVLRSFLAKSKLDELYIYKESDYREMKEIINKLEEYKTNLYYLCLQFNEIFTAVEAYPVVINEFNIESACDDISCKLGYNILTIIKQDVKHLLIQMSEDVGFFKFNKIKNLLSENEKIELPDGTKSFKKQYSLIDFICGQHKIINITYNVSYPNFSLDYLYYIPCNNIIQIENVCIYKSTEIFDISKNGFLDSPHKFIYKDFNGYVYVLHVPAATIVEIDGKLLNNSKKENKLVPR